MRVRQLKAADAVAVGNDAGQTSQGSYAVAVGINAGRYNQGSSATLWDLAGRTIKPPRRAVGYVAGQTIKVIRCRRGVHAGETYQGTTPSLWGTSGSVNQGISAVAVGYLAGSDNQGNYSRRYGERSGSDGSRQLRRRCGDVSGSDLSRHQAVAVGTSAGETNQGDTPSLWGVKRVVINAWQSGSPRLHALWELGRVATIKAPTPPPWDSSGLHLSRHLRHGCGVLGG
jgi:hypothetical protein